MSQSSQAYEGREFEAASNLVNYYNWITDGFRPYLKGDGTEIGAGVGTYSNYIRPFFSSLDLIEPSLTQNYVLKDRFKNDPDVRVFEGLISNYHQHVGDNCRDSICLVNVLEHIQHDLEALNELTAMLRPNGHLCVFVPALPFLYSKLDKIFGHFRRYTKTDLTQKFHAADLKIIECKYIDLLGVPAWGIINTILGSTNLNPKMTKAYDRFFVPCTRTIETMIPATLGKSLMIVGKKQS